MFGADMEAVPEPAKTGVVPIVAAAGATTSAGLEDPATSGSCAANATTSLAAAAETTGAPTSARASPSEAGDAETDEGAGAGVPSFWLCSTAAPAWTSMAPVSPSLAAFVALWFETVAAAGAYLSARALFAVLQQP